MPLLLRPATAHDAPSLTAIYFSAFTHDSISRLVFPFRTPGTSSWNWWQQSIITEIEDLSAHFLCVYDSSSEQIVAYAKWNDVTGESKPGSAEWGGDEEELPTWPEGADMGVADHFFGMLGRRRGDIMGCSDSSIDVSRQHEAQETSSSKGQKDQATLPKWQGKGAAGMLIRWGLERADRQGVECYLEASPVGKEVYEHFGFEERGRLVVPVEGKEDFVECFMVRPAKGGSRAGE
ncbi:hypothetical protein ACMFMG_005330 [Clarireedia jacksonii]